MDCRISGSCWLRISASFVAFDCLAAILAADFIILFFVISSQNPRTEPGFLALLLYCLGMVYFTFFQKILALSSARLHKVTNGYGAWKRDIENCVYELH